MNQFVDGASAKVNLVVPQTVDVEPARGSEVDGLWYHKVHLCTRAIDELTHSTIWLKLAIFEQRYLIFFLKSAWAQLFLKTNVS